jgi:ubiquinone/menaquinone biosynthesis C-methylase UbiE
MDSSPNAEHIQVWNEIIAPKFTRFRDVFVQAALQHSLVALQEFPMPWGARVLDVGCGFGETSIDLAYRVGSSGRVVGIDCMHAPIETARADARRAGLPNVRFIVGDAQIHSFDPVFDVCFSRFGTMFFASPMAALANLRRALVPGGRLLMIVWRALDDNPYMLIPRQVALAHLPPHDDCAPSCGPGPFSMANRETVTEILLGSGYVDIAFRRVDVEMLAGETVEDAVAMAVAVGPAGEIVREAGMEGQKKLPLIETELRSVFGRHLRKKGVLLGSSSWVITASKPLLG